MWFNTFLLWTSWMVLLSYGCPEVHFSLVTCPDMFGPQMCRIQGIFLGSGYFRTSSANPVRQQRFRVYLNLIHPCWKGRANTVQPSKKRGLGFTTGSVRIAQKHGTCDMLIHQMDQLKNTRGGAQLDPKDLVYRGDSWSTWQLDHWTKQFTTYFKTSVDVPGRPTTW